MLTDRQIATGPEESITSVDCHNPTIESNEFGFVNAELKSGKINRTVRLWAHRYQGNSRYRPKGNPREIYKGLSSVNVSSRSKLITMKPRQQASEKADLSRETDNTAAKQNITSEMVDITPGKQGWADIIRPVEAKSVPVVSDDFGSHLIQFDALNLEKIEGFGPLCQKYGLPRWQFSAQETGSGATWIAFGYEIESELVCIFIEALSGHLEAAGINPRRVQIELKSDGELFGQLTRTKFQEIKKSAENYYGDWKSSSLKISDEKSTIDRFHDQIKNRLYGSVTVRTVGKLLTAAQAFMLDYNYKEKQDKPLSLPPYQKLRRRVEGKCNSDILNYRPRVLDTKQGQVAGQLLRLRIMAASIVSFVGAVIARRKRARSGTASSFLSGTMRKPESQAPAIQNYQQTKFEYIDLKSISWKRPRETRVDPNGNQDKIRNRQDMINKARKLLAQKASPAELKRTLPITEGEIAMLNSTKMLQQQTRNI